MVSYKTFVVLGLLAITDFVAGHGCIIAATGDAGGNGTALGIDPSTPRDGTKKKPFEQDTTRFAGAQADTFGETAEVGNNDPETGTTAILAQNGGVLPQVSPGGEVQMTLHQVNADGAGPYTCMINADGTGTTWTQVGTRLADVIMSLTKADGSHTASAGPPWSIFVWLDDQFLAGQDNVCMVRCQNPALAGPFGGVVPVQMPQTSATSAATTGAATNGTAAAAEATSGTASGIAAANTETDNTTPAQKAAELREDAQKKRKIRRASRIERRTAAGIAYRHGVKS
ncbi:hypothetical protein H2202_004292 [Exophiala xenobiotica]|nr:hypothetical protein H2202_004292 [Exophiala xenobiotica]KAK5229355.1 hypothetical protein LTR72_000886 [Exophiala xenobiotica]KAK5233785.1 hypothetical protein LTR47_004903 [Exophiala xenobiotica]KAK5250194.1 hypothetical protein LTS06_004922 [Exophiala xenobiotica]KAK5289734.1 hypothetical protein LTR14_007372 [Exophiala xenobiotica]